MSRVRLVITALGLLLVIGTAGAILKGCRAEPRPRVTMAEVKLFNCDFSEGSVNTVRIPGGMVSTIQIKESPKVAVRLLDLELDPGAARPLSIYFHSGTPLATAAKDGGVKSQLLFDQTSKHTEQMLVVGPQGGKLVIEHRHERGPVLLTLK